MRLAAEMRNPSFLAINPGEKTVLYAVGETADMGGKREGSVAGFTINPENGLLAPINHVSSRGAGPCHLSLSLTGKTVLVANYNGGSVAAFPVKEGGKLGEAASFFQHTGSSVNPNRQKEPHAHSFNPDKRGQYAFAPDLGVDKIFIYKLEADKAVIEPNDPAFVSVAPGSGPRHFTFHPNGRYAYVINELKSTITAFTYDADHGKLTEIQTISTLPAGWEGPPAERLKSSCIRTASGSTAPTAATTVSRCSTSILQPGR